MKFLLFLLCLLFLLSMFHNVVFGIQKDGLEYISLGGFLDFLYSEDKDGNQIGPITYFQFNHIRENFSQLLATLDGVQKGAQKAFESFSFNMFDEDALANLGIDPGIVDIPIVSQIFQLMVFLSNVVQVVFAFLNLLVQLIYFVLALVVLFIADVFYMVYGFFAIIGSLLGFPGSFDIYSPVKL